MSSSRVYRLGTVYSRTKAFVDRGVLKEAEIPVWYKVYESFPPKYEPTYERYVPEISIKEIFYPEDVLRAEIHKGSKEIMNLKNSKPSVTQMNIESYNNFLKEGKSETEAIELVTQSKK